MSAQRGLILLVEEDDNERILREALELPAEEQLELVLGVLRSISGQAQRELEPEETSDSRIGDSATAEGPPNSVERPIAPLLAEKAETIRKYRLKTQRRNGPAPKRVVRVDDPTAGYGPNWSSVDDWDIPTVLRRQMD